MAILKCKMCGGALEINNDSSVITCEYCGSVQTIPQMDDEKKLIQFERAERLRKQCEFDKAAGIYETIVADFRQESEAYWGLVLCKYGIEYVDDPATGKKIPTCHRLSYDSILEDSDFEQAVENADAVAAKVYREEAKQFERIRKDILAVSSDEKPYDIFICYKETDENGDRTIDSVHAQDLYTALTDKGYRVFFSRVTLQGKLGEAYEPYIFAALHSAKVMLAIGTCYEYFNAVWVKNEWSRYLKICAKDKSKHLIPCYKNLDPEDMPKEFRALQGADLGKMGAVQDILFNMEKYIPLQKPKTIVQERVVVGGSGVNKIASLLDRGNMALEDADWAKADSFFEDVLNNDSKNAQAYIGKTLAMEKCRTIDAFARKRKEATLSASSETLHMNPDNAHIEAMAEKCSVAGYVTPDQIRKLYNFDLSYRSELSSRRKQYEQEEYFWANHKQLSRAEQFAAGDVANNLLNEKKALFAALADRIKKAEEEDAKSRQALQERYKAHLAKADEKAEAMCADSCAKREQDYAQWGSIARDADDVQLLTQTAEKLDNLGDFQKCKALAEQCRKRAAEEQAKIDAENEAKRKAEEAKRKAQQAKNKKIAIIAAVAVTICAVFVILLTNVIIPTANYNKAVELMTAGSYTEAIAAFEAMDGYKDSATKITECNTAILDGKYNEAIALMDAGKYTEAISAFEALDGYKDSATKITECNTAILDGKYNEAIALMDAGKYTEAISAFEALDGYKDSATKITECKYNDAITLMDAGNIVEAYEALVALDGYEDSTDKANSIYDKYKVEKLKVAKVGDYVFFGAYEQDNNTSNGKEDVEWRVLEIKDGKALVISKYALDCKPYNTIYTDVTWETCTLRKWLNNDFLGAAFSADEKAMIPTVTVSADKNPGNTTQDQVFLLSKTEVKKYFSSDSARQCKPTDYAVANGADVSSRNGNHCWWWLRTPGASQEADLVYCSGDVYGYGYRLSVLGGYLAVRPALWIDLNS